MKKIFSERSGFGMLSKTSARKQKMCSLGTGGRVAKNQLFAIHPGEFLAEILEDHGMSQAELARAIGISPMRISHVIKGSRPMTAELALLLGRAFGQTPQYWLNLQSTYDLKTAEASLGRKLKSIAVVGSRA